MVQWDDRAENWEYRGEGNFHVIIAHNQNKAVLRLPKRYKDAEKRRKDVLLIQTAAENEISFQKNVVIPLMRECRACVQNQLVKLSTKFLNEIDQLIKCKRPPHRLHKEIDKTCSHGVLLPDFSYVLPRPPVQSSTSHDICIEIKPKKDGNCTYCNLQLVKVKKGTYDRVSSYCPLDLFSGDKHRMTNALRGLIEYPQNNFRVFRNGQLIYSEELRGKDDKIFSNFVLPLIFPEKQDQKIDIFLEALYRLLTYQLVSHSGKEHLQENCPMKSRVSKSLKIEDMDNTASLPSGCVLDSILNVQKLEDRSLDDYRKMYIKVKENSVRESLQASFHEDLWQSTVRSLLNPKSDAPSKNVVQDHVQSLQKFLIATSFKDCSILLALRQNQFDTYDKSAMNISNSPIFIDTGMNAKFWASIAVIDCDPKPVHRIPHYAKVEAETTSHWEKFVQSKKS